MSPDLSRLTALRTDNVVAEPYVVRAREEFTGPESPEIVLAFDQSFAATGWALIRFGTGNIQILACGTIKTLSMLTGALEDIDRAEQLNGHVKHLLGDNRGSMSVLATKVCYETPPKGGRIKNPEVSLMSALAVVLAVAEKARKVAEAVHPKTWKKMATGNGNLKDKRVAHLAVRDWDCVEGFELATNESQRDAVMVGLASQWKEA